MYSTSMKFLIIFFFSFLLQAEDHLFAPLPKISTDLSTEATLGKMLFHDPILSKENTLSCATCHPIGNYGVDNLPQSFGINQAVGQRNTPTVWNALFNASQFWDGRAKSLEEQALGPIINPIEMGETIEAVLNKLNQSSQYKEAFKHVYQSPATAENLAKAIAAFERTLISSGSRFDQFLQGNSQALTTLEKKGFSLFKSKGCVSCHNGINVGGTLFQKIGIFNKFINKEDLGRYNATKKDFDKYYFKVPSLRNVAKTAPYFHDGSVEKLEDAVTMMVQLQLGINLMQDELNSIIAFLKTLTGKIHE